MGIFDYTREELQAELERRDQIENAEYKSEVRSFFEEIKAKIEKTGFFKREWTEGNGIKSGEFCEYYKVSEIIINYGTPKMHVSLQEKLMDKTWFFNSGGKQVTLGIDYGGFKAIEFLEDFEEEYSIISEDHYEDEKSRILNDIT